MGIEQDEIKIAESEFFNTILAYAVTCTLAIILRINLQLLFVLDEPLRFVLN